MSNFDGSGRLYAACKNPACMCKVRQGTAYCCSPCTVAHRDQFDPDGYHSESCQERQTERGRWEYHEKLSVIAFGG